MAVPVEIGKTLQELPDDALVTVVHMMNRFLRYSIAVKAYDSLLEEGKEPAEKGPTHEIALDILRKIERAAGSPISEIENDEIEDYIQSIDELLWQRITQRTFNQKKAKELLSSLRQGTRKRPPR
jgi:hypothetical protein